MLSACPATLDCALVYPDDATSCFVWERNRTLPSDGHFGFDGFGNSVLTVGAIITLDGWDVICRPFRRDIVLASNLAWPIFSFAAVGAGLFTVNLFIASLAYSFIKIRKASRNLDAGGGVKTTLVEKLLNDGLGASESFADGRHILQLLNPPLTRRCRSLLKNDIFDGGTTLVVMVNIVFMTCAYHEPSPEHQRIFDVGEAVFTVAYTLELLIKLQALGFRQYFRFMLNRLDFMIVAASLGSYYMTLVLKVDQQGKGTAVLRMLRLLKLMRAARVAKLIFRSQSVKEMASKAFSGIDAIISLVVFIFFILTLSSIAGMHLFYGCSDGTESRTHVPNFDSFEQARSN